MSRPLSGFSAAARTAADTALARSGPLRRQRKFLAHSTMPFPGGNLVLAAEDIAEPTQWVIEREQHTLIVHLDGEMQRLETRIDRGDPCRAGAEVGELWLIPAGARYVGRALGGRIAYAEYQLDDMWMAQFGGHKRHPIRLRPAMKVRDSLLHGLTGRLLQLVGEEDDLAKMLRDAIAQVIGVHMLREYGSHAPSSTTRHDGLPESVKQRLADYIHSHLDQHLTLEELSDIAGIDVRRLIPAFRATFGETPLQYIIGRRLQLACSLLEGTRQDIASVALACGFSSHSHLSSVFRRRYGVTPQQFRKQAKGLS